VVLFEKSRRGAPQGEKAVLCFVQTAGNHRPFTIPAITRGFDLAQVDDAALRENGFDSLEAYNGMRYLDFSLESFFAKARKAPYFRNTVFVMYGDHGNPLPCRRLGAVEAHGFSRAAGDLRAALIKRGGASTSPPA